MAIATLAMLVCASAANARGTVRVQQYDAHVQTYPGSIIRIVGHTLRVFSPDTRDTLIVSHAACSYLGEIRRCLPYSVTLHRDGADRAIALSRGTVYMNFTRSPQQIALPNTEVPAHGVLIFLRTARGTSIAVNGTIDGVRR